MDPLTVIMAALLAGAAASAETTASAAVKDAYNGLKTLVQRRFKGKPESQLALSKHEEKPEVWESPLKEALRESDAHQDDEIVKAAQELLGLMNLQPPTIMKYKAEIAGNVGSFIQGDNAQVTNTFNGKP